MAVAPSCPVCVVSAKDETWIGSRVSTCWSCVAWCVLLSESAPAFACDSRGDRSDVSRPTSAGLAGTTRPGMCFVRAGCSAYGSSWELPLGACGESVRPVRGGGGHSESGRRTVWSVGALWSSSCGVAFMCLPFRVARRMRRRVKPGREQVRLCLSRAQGRRLRIQLPARRKHPIETMESEGAVSEQISAGTSECPLTTSRALESLLP